MRIRVAATSVNPIDFKRRSGMLRDYFPIQFPGIIGVDVSGTVEKVGPGVTDFAAGDPAFAIADKAYAELCVVPAAILARIPAGLNLIDAAAIPLVSLTGSQLAEAMKIMAGQTVIITGAVGSVGRSAVFTAKRRGATVIAAVRGKQVELARSIGADQVIATDDDAAIAALPMLDAVADTVLGPIAETLMGKVKSGGIFASVLGAPENAKKFPTVRTLDVQCKPNPAMLTAMGSAVRDGALKIPVSKRFPLRDAAQAHAAAEAGGGGKIILVI